MSDEETIRRLLAEFIQLRDDKRFDEWVQLFAEDGTFQYSPEILVGRPAIKAAIGALLRDDRGKHLCCNSIIRVSGDVAEVSSDFVKIDPTATAGAGSFAIAVAGRYEDRWIRHSSSWLLASRRVVLLPAS
jgi:3-phenylpropionate/cinnamic acid dioxygenase small subunit